MRYQSEISRDGPYLRVLLPDVLPPDWDVLRRDLEFELDEGGSRVTLILGECSGTTEDDPSLELTVASLRREGLDVFVLRPPSM